MATTLDFGFSSPCHRASTADCTKLSKHFLGVYWINRWFFLQTSPSCKQNKNKGVIMVPFVRMKLDMSLLLSWTKHNIILFCSFFDQISDIISTYNSIFENWGKVGKVVAQVFRHFNITLNVTKESPIDNSLQDFLFAERTFIGEICPKMVFPVASVRYKSHQLHSHISLFLYPFCWM